MMRPAALFISVLVLSIGGIQIAYSQEILRLKPNHFPIICYSEHTDVHTYVEPPVVFKRLKDQGARIKTATIEVDYYGFENNNQAKQAFAYAVSIWESLITSPVKIRVAAVWNNLSDGVLGSAAPFYLSANFKGAPKYNVYYPGALAEKLAGTDLNDPEDYEILAQFNSSANWYYQTTGTPGNTQHDLVTVVLHELCHGLGFSDTFGVTDGGQGFYGGFTEGVPFVFDVEVQNVSNQKLFEHYQSPSTVLKNQLTNQNIFFNSPTNLNAVGAGAGTLPKLYAPTTFDPGSSIAHVDNIVYIQGDPNSLMRPFINTREVNHNPGPIVVNIFKDLGWVTTYIEHDHLTDRENIAAAIPIKAVVKTDNSPSYNFDANQVYLYYYTASPASTSSIQMQPTGQPNEYGATIPAPAGAMDINYYISVKDNLNRTLTNPGKVYERLQSPQQGHFKFHVGPDTQAPEITHISKTFVSYLDTELVIAAVIEENVGLAEVLVEYAINNGPINTIDLTYIISEQNLLDGGTLFLYRDTIQFAPRIFQDGDEVKYRIIAKDNSSNQNQTVSPSSSFYVLPVKGLAPSQNYYNNNFNTPSDDFIGTNFSIQQPQGFTNPAIHSIHPYPEPGEGGELSLTYQLRIPIKLKSTNALLKFDEIVLVEPGASGSVFGSNNFFDYAIVEGSKDGGQTWTSLVNGYDSRDYAPWLARYNSNIVGQNSAATGDPSLFRQRTINLLSKFAAGDEVVIRFRLYIDDFASGWGWAIDNVKIQVDDVAPEISHNHLDYVLQNSPSLPIPVAITDDMKLEKVIFEFKVNNASPIIQEQVLTGTEALVDFSVDISALQLNDIAYYRIQAVDTAGNIRRLPEEDYFAVPVISFAVPVNKYSNDFNSSASDFVGNFFRQLQPSGFSSPAIHTYHPYPAGFGTNKSSNFIYTLKTPIALNASNPYIRFDEICIVEDHPASAVFGSAGFNDYVIVEGSADNGATWKAFLNGYDARAQSIWASAYTTNVNGNMSHYRTRLINMLENGNFSAGQNILVRFRLFSNPTKTGWGWAIDNLHIQDIVTDAEEITLLDEIKIYPNPTYGDDVIVSIPLRNPKSMNLSLLNAQGMILQEFELTQQEEHRISTKQYASGIYLVRLSIDGKTVTKKLLITR